MARLTTKLLVLETHSVSPKIHVIFWPTKHA